MPLFKLKVEDQQPQGTLSVQPVQQYGNVQNLSVQAPGGVNSQPNIGVAPQGSLPNVNVGPGGFAPHISVDPNSAPPPPPPPHLAGGFHPGDFFNQFGAAAGRVGLDAVGNIYKGAAHITDPVFHGANAADQQVQAISDQGSKNYQAPTTQMGQIGSQAGKVYGEAGVLAAQAVPIVKGATVVEAGVNALAKGATVAPWVGKAAALGASDVAGGGIYSALSGAQTPQDYATNIAIGTAARPVLDLAGGALGKVAAILRGEAPVAENVAREAAPAERQAARVETPPAEPPRPGGLTPRVEPPGGDLSQFSDPQLAIARKQIIDNLTQHEADLLPHTQNGIVQQTPEALAVQAERDQAHQALDHINGEFANRFRASKDLAEPSLTETPQAKPGETTNSAVHIGNQDVPVTETKSTLGQPSDTITVTPSEVKKYAKSFNVSEKDAKTALSQPQTAASEPGNAAAVAKNVSREGVAPEGGVTAGLPPEAKRNSLWTRTLDTKLSNIEKASPKGGTAGSELKQTINNRINTQRDVFTRFEANQPTVKQLGHPGRVGRLLGRTDEFSNFVDVLEGKADPINSKVVQAVAEAKAALQQLHGEASQYTGVNFRENYFPHSFTEKYIKSLRQGTSEFNLAVNHLVSTKQAPTTADAIHMVLSQKSELNTHPGQYGHFKGRTMDLPGYEKTPDAYWRYGHGAAGATADAKHFGIDGSALYNGLAKIGAEGGDVATAGKAVEQILHPLHPNPVVDKVLKGFSFARLGKAPIPHMGQTLNTAADYGYINTAKAWDKVLDGTMQDYLVKVGHNSELELNRLKDQEVLSKGTALGLSPVMRINRDVTAIAGKLYADALALKGNIAELRRIGVTGDIGKTLTEEQQIEASRAAVDKDMFRSTPADTPMNAEGTWGRMFGQYRTAYQFKQTLNLIRWVKEAKNGNPAPLIRYAAGAAPLGYAVTSAKNLVSGHDESQDPWYTRTLHIAENAGALGLPGAVLSAVDFGKDANTSGRVQAAAGLVAPVAGEGFRIARAGVAAAGGNWKPAEKYAAGLIPAFGTRTANALVPPASPEAIAYAKAMDNARNGSGLSADEKTKFDEWRSKQLDDQGRRMEENPSDTIGNSRTLWKNDNLRNAVQKAQQSLGNHDPMWDLSPDKLKAFMDYQQQYTGDAAKSFIADNNPWIKDVIQQRTDYYNSLDQQNKLVKNPDRPQRPNIDPQTQSLLDGMDQLDAAGKTQLFHDHPELQDAMAQISAYTNKMRIAEGAPPLQEHVQPSPEVQGLLDTYNALPKGNGPKGGSPDRAVWIKSHPDQWNAITDYMTQSSVYSTIKNVAKAQFQGAQLDQQALKGIKNLGQYDIVKNADGSYSLNPGGSNSGGSSSGGYRVGYGNSFGGSSGYGPGGVRTAFSSDPALAFKEARQAGNYRYNPYTGVSFRSLSDVSNPEPTKGKVKIKPVSAGNAKIRVSTKVPKGATKIVK